MPSPSFPVFTCAAASATSAVGAELSMVIDAGPPRLEAMSALSQSRSVPVVSVTVPVPAPLLPTFTVNSVPPGAVAPQGRPRMAQSTV